MTSRKVPSSKGVSEGPMMTAFLFGRSGGLEEGTLWWLCGWDVFTYHVMTLSAMGLALTPAGGSVCMRLKSRIRRLLAAVDMAGGGGGGGEGGGGGGRSRMTPRTTSDM